MNYSNRTFIVGDIHGCHDELQDLLSTIHFSKTDRVIAVGDLISKGPGNQKVLDLFISDGRFSSVLGNQDYAVLQRLQGIKQHYSKAQKQTARELEPDRDRYIEFLSSLPLTIDLESHAVVHAGVRPGIPLAHQQASDLLELRTLGKKPARRKGTPWYEVYDDPKFVLFGHWPQREPRRAAHALGLDTGCVYGHRLTAFDLDTGELISVPARRVYSEGSGTFNKSSDGDPLQDDQTIPIPESTNFVHASATIVEE